VIHIKVAEEDRFNPPKKYICLKNNNILFKQMEITNMSSGIIKLLNEKYNKNVIKDCLDITQIVSICNLYNNNNNNVSTSSISLNDIDFSSPVFKKNSKKNSNILESKEFKKKYSFFIKIIFACLKINVDIFDIVNESIIFKNMYALIKSIELSKKKLIMEHIELLKNHHRSIAQKIDATYFDEYIPGFIAKNKVIDKILESIKKLMKAGVINNTDNLFVLVLPYFYTYTKYIEEYNEKMD